MTNEQFAHLSELVKDIKATGDPAIAAIACRALSNLLTDDPTSSDEDIEA